MSTKRT